MASLTGDRFLTLANNSQGGINTKETGFFPQFNNFNQVFSQKTRFLTTCM
jgi:hypothetical protein